MNEDLEVDLKADLADLCRRVLLQYGYKASTIGNLDDAETVRTRFSVERRLVSQRPRRVLKSRGFSCPPGFAHGLSDVEHKVRCGINLSPYLSKNILCPEYNDDLLNHWDIHHLHLGTEIGSDGFTKRPKPQQILFSRFDDETGYFIDVLPHDGNWVAQDLVRTLHENWPESLERFRIPHVGGTTLRDTEVRILRKKNTNHILRMVDGTVYLPPGGGTTKSGASAEATVKAMYWLRWAETREKEIRDDFPNIKARARAMGVIFSEPAKFQLTTRGDTWGAEEVSSGYWLALIDP